MTYLLLALALTVGWIAIACLIYRVCDRPRDWRPAAHRLANPTARKDDLE